MAKKTIVEVLSDLSGKPDAVTVFFSWAGVGYEVDLTPDESAKIEKALAPILEVAHSFLQRVLGGCYRRETETFTLGWGVGLVDKRENGWG